MTMGPLARKSPKLWALYFLYTALFDPVLAQNGPEVDVVAEGRIWENATISCTTSPTNAKVSWLFQTKPVEISERITTMNETKQKKMETEMKDYRVTTMTIVNATRNDAGNYTCIAELGSVNVSKDVVLDLSFIGKFVPQETVYVNVNESDHKIDTKLRCVFELYNDEPTVEWWQPGSELPYIGNATRISDKQIESTFTILKVGNKHNGTYLCNVFDSVKNTNVTGQVDLIVYDKPHVYLDSVIGISKSQIYFNWTVETHNANVTSYTLSYQNIESEVKQYSRKEIGTNSTSFVLSENLNASTEYRIRLTAKTPYGESNTDEKTGATLDRDPNFVPNISINGFSATSVTIGWAPPPSEIEHLIHYYLLEAKKKDGGAPRNAYHSRDARNLPYMFDNLEPHSTYIFKVRACQDYTKTCGNWSEEMEAATLDGIPGRPSNVTVNCSSSQMFLAWQPPEKPNAEIKGYTMELTGVATYRDRTGHPKKETYGPLSRFTSNDSTSARFDDLRPNTNYTVRLSAMTRTRRRGEEEVAYCRTTVAPPDAPPRPRWRKILENNRYLFKLYLPKVSERNGPICCYRVYMVRMPPNKDLKDLKINQHLEVIDYEEAHSAHTTIGAYIADIFTNENFPPEGELIMGDDISLFNESDTSFHRRDCRRCIRRPPRPVEPPPRTTVSTTTEEDDGITSDPVAEDEKRSRRSIDVERDYGNMPLMKDPAKHVDDERVKVKDGPLDSNSNYTLFVELIPGTIDDEPKFSEYINLLMPAPSPVAAAPSTVLEIALQATCAVAALVLLIMIIFCIMQTRKTRKMPHAYVEMNNFHRFYRYVVDTMGGRQQLVSSAPPDMPPIAKEDLAAAYAERHADSDYGFQKEFELLQMLSECFPDRTTHASEARENQPKNRYPDIKAYDQTRVKLSQVDGITGSDYINANYVMGYKERKQFICAQGPTDTTVNDFWRMIWEHGLELIVMLTNLEEYSKVKCSKYWPDEVRGARAFGAITVQHVSEKRYSDYIVRELKITKQPTNVDGQPIYENNGIAKRNGDIKEASESAPTSPREAKDTGEARIVRQYHFLMWKDFAAPEHPHSILKFIKRVNEAWLNMVGRPVVVHCSAGVGRTGTLVALDCLLEQLRATGHAAVFNTIADMRRQRNFLVQSQKQYVFVYRALVEYAHYGDTEIPAGRLKSAVDRLRNTPEGGDKCLMEHEFEKLLDSPVAEAAKSCAAGLADELRTRNRSADCLPYDRNRVMLTPIPGRDYSTYINASFVEAYDNSEGFIITQDPLPCTIFDFWRMVSEQSVSTIVMLSELGEGKCPRYWDDGTAQYEHISVQYDDSESCPYYTRRQFRITNNKFYFNNQHQPIFDIGNESIDMNRTETVSSLREYACRYGDGLTTYHVGRLFSGKTGHVCVVRQLQYQGWPTAPGHVPEVTRGLAELADACAPNIADAQGPMLVHCHLGTERSALFVALCILICQLRTERRVDVSAVARKVRAQRAHTIDTFLQYEFLHRAILNYAELHNLLEDS